MTFDTFVFQAFWALLAVVGGYVGFQMHRISESVIKLNKNMAVHVTSVKVKIENHEKRLERLEEIEST